MAKKEEVNVMDPLGLQNPEGQETEVSTEENAETTKATEETSEETASESPAVDETTIAEGEGVIENHEPQIEESEVAKVDKKMSEEVEKAADKIYDKVYGGEEGRKRLYRADKQTKKDMYVNDYIIPIGDRPDFETDGERDKREWLELYQYWRAGRPVTVRITGEERDSNNIPYAICFRGDIKIKIPGLFLGRVEADQIKRAEAGKIDERTLLNNLSHIVRQRMGSEVDVVIHELNEERREAVGSRNKALDIQENASYCRKRNDRYAINEGDIVEGRICYVTRSSLCVEVFGKELILKEQDCLWTRTNDLKEEFKPGQRVPVLMKKLERVEERGKVTKLIIRGSIKEAKPNPRLKVFNKIVERSTRLGKVTQITEGGIFVRLKDNEFDILCSPPKNFDLPLIGDEVLISINKKFEQTLTATGHFVRIIG
ncbi:hypothetical protein M2146_001044 [Lachnospiraceae bacterium PF1-22]